MPPKTERAPHILTPETKKLLAEAYTAAYNEGVPWEDVSEGYVRHAKAMAGGNVLKASMQIKLGRPAFYRIKLKDDKAVEASRVYLSTRATSIIGKGDY